MNQLKSVVSTSRVTLNTKLLFDERDTDRWIEVRLYGIFASEMGHDVVIFKDKTEKKVMSVLTPSWWSSLTEATLSRVLNKIGVHVSKCFFSKIKKGQPMARLEFSQPEGVVEGHVEELLHFCMQRRKTRFFATQEYMDRCKLVDASKMPFFMQSHYHAVSPPSSDLN